MMNGPKLSLGSAVWVGAMVFVSVGTALAQTWTVLDLGPGKAEDINSLGQVVGDNVGGSYVDEGWLWSDGVRTDIGNLAGQPTGWTVAFAINDHGQIVGESRRADSGMRGFLWQDGVMTELGVISGSFSKAFELSNLGQVVGKTEAQSGTTRHGCIWQDGVMSDLAPLPGDDASTAHMVTESGVVIGYSKPSVSSTSMMSCVWEDGVVSSLGLFGGTVSEAYGINESKQIVGYYLVEEYYTAYRRGYLWDDGWWTDLGLLPDANDCRARDINESGQIVGDSGGRAFLWQNGQLFDLNDLIDPNGEWTLAEAKAINDRGVIVGKGYNPSLGGGSRGFVLYPPDRYALTVTVEGESGGLPWGHVDIDPFDPNLEYLAGTSITLYAIPHSDSTFEEWIVYDPNHPDDANHAATSDSNPLTVVMHTDREVTAVFDRRCGCGVEQGTGMLGVMGLMWLAVPLRRRR